MSCERAANVLTTPKPERIGFGERVGHDQIGSKPGGVGEVGSSDGRHDGDEAVPCKGRKQTALFSLLPVKRMQNPSREIVPNAFGAKGKRPVLPCCIHGYHAGATLVTQLHEPKHQSVRELGHPGPTNLV